MLSNKVERVRGMNDILPADYEIGKKIEEQLISCFASCGYRPVGVPLIEYTDLYLRKSGEDTVSRLYDFNFQNRRLSLRPEMTASVIRMYVTNLQELPLPVRVYYVGPVFRYEKPQRGRYRQFTQMGIELIGAASALADAEVIHNACKGLRMLGLSHYQGVIGHIGILLEFLEGLGLESRLRSFLFANMETLRREGKDYIAQRLIQISPALHNQVSQEKALGELDNNDSDTLRMRNASKLADILSSIDETEARIAILDLLASMNFELDGSREPAEIVSRLLAKMKRRNQAAQIRQALEFMWELGQLVGEPSEVLREAENLLKAYGLSCSPLDQLRQILRALDYYQLDWTLFKLDFGMSRGLQYYTGMIFEIYQGNLGEERQLCGGGRYDDLVATYGGRRDTAAVGFSYGIERLRLALEQQGKAVQGSDHKSVDLLVIPLSSDDHGYAITVAERLRTEGLQVENDVRGRSVTSNFQHADKQGLPFVIVVGSQESLTSEVILKDMASREEQRIHLNNLARTIKQLRLRHA